MPKSVLLIDDEKLILQTLSSIFIKQGWDVETCQSGVEGLRKIEKNKYSCIFLDIRMPDMNGAEVITKLRELEGVGRINKQNVIIMTGYADENATVKVFQQGAFHYLEKPFNVQQVLDLANKCLEHDALLDTLDESEGIDDQKTFKKIRKEYDKKSLDKKADILAKQLNINLRHIRGCTYDTGFFRGNIENPIGITQIPLGLIGPISVNGKAAKGEFLIPMATTEGALLLTYDLGARIVSMGGGVDVEVISKNVHISPMFPIANDEDEKVIRKFITQNYEHIQRIAEGGSSHTKLLEIVIKRIKNNLVLKCIYDTADAHGLNMINQASFNICKYIEAKTGFAFYHRSHYSGVKHHSLLNEREGYGRRVIAKTVIPAKALGMLRVTAQQLKDFTSRCIECGTASEISCINVHASNGITAIFLACGQDMADISSAHVCKGKCEIVNGKDIYWECDFKNLLIATVGGGTGLGTQKECLEIMGCYGSGMSDKFAELIAAAVLAGEIPTAAAVISQTYVDIHNKYGRNKQPKNIE